MTGTSWILTGWELGLALLRGGRLRSWGLVGGGRRGKMTQGNLFAALLQCMSPFLARSGGSRQRSDASAIGVEPDVRRPRASAASAAIAAAAGRVSVRLVDHATVVAKPAAA